MSTRKSTVLYRNTRSAVVVSLAVVFSDVFDARLVTCIVLAMSACPKMFIDCFTLLAVDTLVLIARPVAFTIASEKNYTSYDIVRMVNVLCFAMLFCSLLQNLQIG